MSEIIITITRKNDDFSGSKFTAQVMQSMTGRTVFNRTDAVHFEDAVEFVAEYVDEVYPNWDAEVEVNDMDGTYNEDMFYELALDYM
jgi:hypothetical protein